MRESDGRDAGGVWRRHSRSLMRVEEGVTRVLMLVEIKREAGSRDGKRVEVASWQMADASGRGGHENIYVGGNMREAGSREGRRGEVVT